MDFYQFFSFSAKKAIYRANEICAQFSNQYLEPEHIFYSTLNLRSCSAVQVLHALEVNLPKLTYSIEAYLYEHAGSYKGSASFSKRTIGLLDQAMKEIKLLKHREIGTTHLLIALAQDRAPFLRQLFAEHNLSSDRIRDRFMTHLKGYSHVGRSVQSAVEAHPPEEPAPGYTKVLPPHIRQAIDQANWLAVVLGHEYVQPEHLVFTMLLNPEAFAGSGVDPAQWDRGALLAGLLEHLRQLPSKAAPKPPEPGRRLVAILSKAFGSIVMLDLPEISPGSIFSAMLQEQESFVSGLFHHAGIYDEHDAGTEADSGQLDNGDNAVPADDDNGAGAE